MSARVTAGVTSIGANAPHCCSGDYLTFPDDTDCSNGSRTPSYRTPSGDAPSCECQSLGGPLQQRSSGRISFLRQSCSSSAQHVPPSDLADLRHGFSHLWVC